MVPVHFNSFKNITFTSYPFSGTLYLPIYKVTFLCQCKKGGLRPEVNLYFHDLWDCGTNQIIVKTPIMSLRFLYVG